MTTETFHAERQPNGDVWITLLGLPQSFKPIVIPKKHCAELATLLWPNMMSHSAKLEYAGTVPSTDYARGEGELE